MASRKVSASMIFRTRIIMIFVFMILFGIVAGRFFYLSVMENDFYQSKANEQHFGSIKISANRGSIFDAKGITLAKSATVYKVFLDPSTYKDEMEQLQKDIDERNEEKAKGTFKPVIDKETNKEVNPLPESVEKFTQDAIEILSESLEIKPEKVTEAMEKNNQYVVLKTQVEKPVADKVLDFFNQYSLTCLNVEEDTKRYYPQNDLASSVIGFTSGDGSGAYGIEAYYDNYLAGVDGKTISAKDSNGNELPYRYSKSYPAQDGDDVYLTIDMNIQYYLEKHLAEMYEEHKIENRCCAILMNAKTGAVYGMATYPTFDLNEPYNIADKNIAELLSTLDDSTAEQKELQELEKQRKNKCITEVYEPGSVFKVITSAAAIEENLINIDTDTFYCSGGVTFPGLPNPINCHDTGGHGSQTFQQALTNSCNPAFMEIGGKLGVSKFAYYFSAFGLNEPTGIDLPAETSGIGGYDTMSEVDLAVSSFGQMETITPMEMITSYCAAINGGYLLQPYVVDKIVDKSGNVVLKNERTVRRQVVSEETSVKMRDALEKVVTNNNGGNVTIKGYSIGGKSGTSERLSISSDDYYGASYVCFTPADDPELILLVLGDIPDPSTGYYGSEVAVPVARDILTDVLPYMGFYPEYTEEEVEHLDVKVPLLQTSLADAKATLEELGVNCKVIGDGSYVVAQSPVTGSSIANDGTVYLYTDERNTVEYTTVPDMIGLSPALANEDISYWGLNYIAKGASIFRDGAVVSKQSYEAGTRVPKGTTIELEFMVHSQQD